MTLEEAIKDAKIRADRSGMVWYVVLFDYGYDCVTEQYVCKKGQVKTNKTIPNLKYRPNKDDKHIIDEIMKLIKKK